MGTGSRVLFALRYYVSVSEGDNHDTVGGVSHKKDHLNCRYSLHPWMFIASVNLN